MGKLVFERIATLRAVVENCDAAVLEVVNVDLGLQFRLVNSPTGRRKRLAEMGPGCRGHRGVLGVVLIGRDMISAGVRYAGSRAVRSAVEESVTAASAEIDAAGEQRYDE